MRIDLLDLLCKAEIVHPSTIRSVEMRERLIEAAGCTASDLYVSLIGHAWWRPGRKDDIETAYEFLFEDLYDGTLGVRMVDSHFDEALEDFSIQSLIDTDWAQGGERQIFCSGPLRDPFSLYMALEEHLLAADTYMRPEDFLNWPSSLRKFAEMTASGSYLVARAPIGVCKIVVDELERQCVPHNLVGGSRVATDVQAAKGLWVRLNGSSFLCRGAVAILPD